MASAELAIEGSSKMYEVIKSEFFGGSALAGLSFMIFNLLCAPCVAAMGAIKKEMNNGLWCAFAIGYMCTFAYAMSLMVYQIGSLISGSFDPIGVIAAFAVLALMIYMLVRPNKYEKKLTISK